jgi:hypothetical protein
MSGDKDGRRVYALISKISLGEEGTKEHWEHNIAAGHKLRSLDMLTDWRSIAGIAVSRA